MDVVRPWAKLDRDGDGRITAALPLADHCLDVGSAFAALVPAWRGALEAAAGRPLTERDIDRLAVIAALHDIGKANHGFQARFDPQRPPVGHTSPVAALLRHSKLSQSAAARALLTPLRSWRAVQLFVAGLAHHGRPLEAFDGSGGADDIWVDLTRHWFANDGYDPIAAVLGVLAAIRGRWPAAWDAGPPLPATLRFVTLFAGLVTLADWIGSDIRRFPIGIPHGSERDALRDAAARASVAARGAVPLATPDADFRAIFGNAPYDFQTAAADDDLGPVALIEAETGSGKTEAALWRWIELRRRGLVDGLYFALPTRSAAVQLQRRVDDMLKRVWDDGPPEAVLAVPGYLRSGDTTGQKLPGYAVRWDEREPGGPVDARWAAERSDRYLAARVAVGTIDQALLGAVQVRHAMVRSSALARSLLVVDEVHASDAYMTGLLEQLLANHVAAGGHALLLSATLGGTTRARLLGRSAPSLSEALATPYPALSGRTAAPRPVRSDGRTKQVAITIAGWIDDPMAIADAAIDAARSGASVLVVRNSVAGAVAVAQAVAERADDLAFKVDGIATLHHGRFARDDRERLDRAVETAFGKGRPARGQILVGTQTLEQSLDIDADYLITDLAPMDVLLQRIGRLHRHVRTDRGAFADARVLVLRPAERDLSPLLARRRHVYRNVALLETTLRLIETTPRITIPDDNRRLVEHALHPDAVRAVADALGTEWSNHVATHAGGEQAALGTARSASLDLDRPFHELTYVHFDEDNDPATRLGARDLIVDLPDGLDSPFGGTVRRVSIPSWMAGTVGPKDEPEVGGPTDFRLAANQYRYDQWGLAKR